MWGSVSVNIPSTWEQRVTPFASLHVLNDAWTVVCVKVSCNRLHLAGGRYPSNEALPCTLGQRTCTGLRLGPGVGSWRDLHPHFHLHLLSCCVIRSSHTARAGPGPSRIISFCFRMPFLWSGILGIKFSSHLRRRRHQHHFVSFNNFTVSTTYLFAETHHSQSVCVCVCVCVYVCVCVCVACVRACVRACAA